MPSLAQPLVGAVESNYIESLYSVPDEFLPTEINVSLQAYLRSSSESHEVEVSDVSATEENSS